jgi:hypothetical protein
MVVTAPSSDLVLQEAKTLTLYTNIQLWASLASEYLQLQLKPYVKGALQILSDNINTIFSLHQNIPLNCHWQLLIFCSLCMLL